MNQRNFFAELKRRNVYKVAVAYAVVAWVLVQAASILFPTYEAPPWVMKVFVAVIALGFPIALVIGWMFEMTPEGVRRTENDGEIPKPPRRHVWIYVVLVGAAFSVGLFFVGRYSAGTAHKSAAAISDKSIAVLPFDNLSRDPDNAFFAEGVQDEILTRLAKIADLKVIGRTSTQKFKSAPDDLRAIAQQLGVAHILEGSVQKAGDKVRVSVQLINALTDTHLWAETYDRQLTDIFAVESEIAKAVAETLRAKLTGTAGQVLASRPTQDPEAHQLYLRGRYLWNRRTEADIRKAAEYYEQAIAKDPSYALAYAGLADSYGVLPNYSNDPPKPFIERAIAAARRALQLDDSLAEGHAALGNALATDYQFAEAEREFKRAFALNQSYATAHQWYGEMLQSLGRSDEAIAELRHAHDHDPLSLIINTILAGTYYTAGRDEEAWQQIRRTLELDPNFSVAFWVRALLHERQGNFDAAIAHFRSLEGGLGTDQGTGMIASAYALSGRRAEAEKILQEMLSESQRRFVGSYWLAQIYATLGNKEEALRRLEQAYDERTIPIGGAGTGGPIADTRFDSLRGDPRFQKLVAKFKGETK